MLYGQNQVIAVFERKLSRILSLFTHKTLIIRFGHTIRQPPTNVD